MQFWRIMQFFHVPVGVRHQLCFCQINLFCLQLLDGRFLEHFISSLNFYQGPKAWKIAEWVCIVNFVILYIMFQPSDLTTATKVFIEFNMGFLCRATMVQCINVKFLYLYCRNVIERLFYTKFYAKLLTWLACISF